MKKQKFKHKCERCKYKWYSNKENIKYCTNCKNPILLTSKKVGDLQCCKCKHKWKQRGDKVPKECPSCKNPNWDKIDSKQMVKLIVGDFWNATRSTGRMLKRNAISLNKVVSPVAVSVSNENNLIVNPRRYEKPYIDLTKRRK